MRQGTAYLAWRLGLWVLLSAGAQGPASRWLAAMALRFPGDVHVLLSQAHLLSASGELQPAINTLTLATQLHPRNGVAWFNRAYLLEQLGQWEEARAAFEQAIDCQPQLDRAWYGLGLCLIRLGRLDEAACALQRNTELQPMSPYGWYQLARVKFDLHDEASAQGILQKLKGFDPQIAAQLARELGAPARESPGAGTVDNRD